MKIKNKFYEIIISLENILFIQNTNLHMYKLYLACIKLEMLYFRHVNGTLHR